VPREAGVVRVLQRGCGHRCEIDAQRHTGRARRRDKRAALTLLIGTHTRLPVERVAHQTKLGLRMALQVETLAFGETRVVILPIVGQNRSSAVATGAL
jgi:hypothetical protein